ncbi:MAG: sensor histidine kinase [Proteobacteria bacterium]|nr:sensor histidine kinase [Pseudomonadota bacterium]
MSLETQVGKRRYVIYGNLIWLVWALVDLFFNNQIGAAWIVATTVSLALFLFIYTLFFTVSRRYAPWLAASVAALGFAVAQWNHSAGVTYMIYACAFFANTGSVRSGILAMVGVIALFILYAWWQDWPWVAVIAMSMVAFSVGGGNLIHHISEKKDSELRLSHDEIRRLASTAERERIGRDLHDLLGHTLSLITLKSELANRLFDRDAAGAKREMADVERVARDALAQVRRAVTGIRAAGIAAELASGKLLLESNGVRLDYALADANLPVDVETALAMTVREALTNIQRHARATHASVALECEDNRLVLRIADNGRGGDIVPGNGLTGMRERLDAIGAELRVDSQRGHGTTIIASMSPPQQVSVATAIELRTT